MDQLIDLSIPIRIPINEKEIKEEILGRIASEVNKVFYREMGWNREQDAEPLREIVREEIRKMIEENRNTIIDVAAKEVIRRSGRRKAVREAQG